MENNKEVEIIYYSELYNQYMYNYQLVSDLALLISQLLSTNKSIVVLKVPSPLKDTE